MSFNKGVATFELYGGQIRTATGLPAGLKYQVTEESAEGWTTTWTGQTGEIEKGQTKRATAKNDHQTGDLEIDKTVVSSDAADLTSARSFNFTVTLDQDITAEFYTAYSVKGGKDEAGTIQFTDGVSETITLGADDELRIIGLPDGVGYKVEEAEKSGKGFGIGRLLFGEGDDYYAPVIFNGEGTIASERITYVTFINRKDKTLSHFNENDRKERGITVSMEKVDAGTPDPAYLAALTSSPLVGTWQDMEDPAVERVFTPENVTHQFIPAADGGWEHYLWGLIFTYDAESGLLTARSPFDTEGRRAKTYKRVK